VTTDIPTLTSAQQRLVRDSFDSVQEYSTALIKLFYGRLFEIAPAVRPLFQPSLDEQSSKLLQMLATVIERLDRFEELREPLFELGRRHVGYGAKPVHYESVRRALLWALADKQINDSGAGGELLRHILARGEFTAEEARHWSGDAFDWDVVCAYLEGLVQQGLLTIA